MPKTEHQNFEESDDPAVKVLEYLMATDRNPTVGRLRGELEDLGMTKASQIISNSEEGWSLSDYMIVIRILHELDLQEFWNNWRTFERKLTKKTELSIKLTKTDVIFIASQLYSKEKCARAIKASFELLSILFVP